MDHKKEICRIGRKLAEKGFVAATDGNISCKIAPDRILITPSGISKGELTEDCIITINSKGTVVAGSGKPSSEIAMHLMVYAQRPDVTAVIHAHPPITTALTIAGIELAQCVIPEVVITMGRIPTAEYATPCSEEGALVIKNLIHEVDAIILDRHGSLTVGDTLEKAYFKLEKLEHAAHVTSTARMLGSVKVLPEGEVQKLIALRQKLGVQSRSNPCDTCKACDRPNPSPLNPPPPPKDWRTGIKGGGDKGKTANVFRGNISHDVLIEVLTDEILKRVSK